MKKNPQISWKTPIYETCKNHVLKIIKWTSWKIIKSIKFMYRKKTVFIISYSLDFRRKIIFLKFQPLHLYIHERMYLQSSKVIFKYTAEDSKCKACKIMIYTIRGRRLMLKYNHLAYEIKDKKPGSISIG